MSLPEKKQVIHRLTKQDLLLLLNEDDEEELLLILNKTSFGFEPFLRNREYRTRNNEMNFGTYDCIIEIIYRVCNLRHDNCLGRVAKFLKMLINCEKFLFQDALLMINECLECGQAIDLAGFTKKYIIVLKTMMRQKQLNTKQIIDVAYPALQNVLNEMQNKRVRNFRKTKYECDELKKLVDSCGISFESDADDDKYSSFRKLSIMPKENDVINTVVPDLPLNKIDGPYNSVDHYLSVHFRLMREDMLRMFRKCVAQHINPSDINKSVSLTYEVEVEFPPEYKPEGIVYDIRITTDKLADWSKNVLMKGNLVCLTKDDYNSVAFAVVNERPRPSENKSTEYEAKIIVEDNCDEVLETGVNYRMFETNAYFECYRHVLGAIKEFNENSLPLSDSLVYLDFENSEPEYLVNSNFLKGIKYCLHEKCNGYGNRLDSPISRTISGKSKDEMILAHYQPSDESKANSLNKHHEDRIKKTISCDCKQFDPLQYDEWPSATELKMDDQQLKAFQLALTNKISVIQGPPGTGKTFIGVKIVKTLLQNVPLTPIVICCFSNHALDQFLTNILQHTQNVVRLGSQSKSEVVNPHSLENLMAAYKNYSNVHKNSVLRADNIENASLNHLKMYVPELLKTRPTSNFDPHSKKVKDVSRKLNELYDTFCMCRDEYLCDSALNEIIDSKDINQLRIGSETNSQYLVTSVLEWLGCSKTSRLYDACKSRFKKLKHLEINESIPTFKLWSISMARRFQLLFVWREKCLSNLLRSIDNLEKEYRRLRRTHYKRHPEPVAMEILQKALVIGVTTTGAAKCKSLLRFINPKILLVEEAAAVLESHVISSLLPSTQHLILIGDHKQLRPIPADNELAEVYNLKISMFERLFQNNAPSATLISQHRMKPCIAELLIQDELYLDLKSYENVYKYENIKGVKYSMFFLNHNKAESLPSSSTSSSNDYEAKMVVLLAKYLTNSTYSEDQITILATYAAQVPVIQKLLDEIKLPIFVTTVDNYQGEENDIVIVSFVRSNTSGSIGFLKENNRVCVALSRARKGLFCFGNFSSYSSQSPLWGSVVRKLEAQNMIGPKLPLVCSRHEREILVEYPEDIQKLLNQGCNVACGMELTCGHHCSRRCHYDDPEHIQYQCAFPCENYITETTKCSRLCFEPCKRKKQTIYLDCGHPARSRKDGTIVAFCSEKMTKILPCNHEVQLSCSTDSSTYSCRVLIKVDLSCGHQALVLCHKSKDLNHIICDETVPVISPCGHTVQIPCYLNLDPGELLSFCTSSCDQFLTCGHVCTGNCRSCSDTGIHEHCIAKCNKKLECGHKCPGYCGTPCLSCNQNCLLSCSHDKKCISRCCRPCIPCEKNCERKCVHRKCSKKCFEPCSVQPCHLPCNKKLHCGHKCIGLCGDPCPRLCRVCHEDELTSGHAERDHYVQLDDCGHVIEITTLKEHIDLCLGSFMWPDCPECKEPIKRSLRYKTQLFKAKDFVLKNSDCSKDIEEANCLLDSVISSDNIVPTEFQSVYKKIADILHRDKPTSGSLYVLNHCLVFLADLMVINNTLKKIATSEKSVALKSRFEALLFWVSDHLTIASYRQLAEVGKAIEKLKSNLI